MHQKKLSVLPFEDMSPVRTRVAKQRPAMAWRILTAVSRLRWKRSVLLWMRFAANPPLILGWWRWLAAFSASRDYPLPHDDLLQKPLSKFLVYGLSGSERLGVLIDHFTIAEKILSRDSMTRLWSGETLDMGDVQGRNETYSCRLVLADRCGGRHEGAFGIELVRSRDEAALCTVRFTLVRESAPQGYTFVVGSMQGPRNAKRLIVETTRDLSGLRPKEAVLMVLQGLVAEGNARHFRAVSQAKHPILYRRSRRQSMLRSNIDGFWCERCGEPDDTYGFVVPSSRIDRNDRRNSVKAQFNRVGELFC
ncbi:DUF535 family protein [Shinella sumterensis]|uniref:DUF535 family protein n=1 Tax=Shinella sumterensis TaxID=1967501 RepID=UPI003F84AC3A